MAIGWPSSCCNSVPAAVLQRIFKTPFGMSWPSSKTGGPRGGQKKWLVEEPLDE
jgi:hypothetical protein